MWPFTESISERSGESFWPRFPSAESTCTADKHIDREASTSFLRSTNNYSVVRIPNTFDYIHRCSVCNLHSQMPFWEPHPSWLAGSSQSYGGDPLSIKSTQAIRQLRNWIPLLVFWTASPHPWTLFNGRMTCKGTDLPPFFLITDNHPWDTGHRCSRTPGMLLYLAGIFMLLEAS